MKRLDRIILAGLTAYFIIEKPKLTFKIIDVIMSSALKEEK